MKIKLVAFGKIKEKWLQEGIREYQKRLGRYVELEILELAEAKEALDDERALALEAGLVFDILAKNKRSFLLLLDTRGKAYSSLELASSLPSWFERGQGQLVVVIGSYRGLSDELRRAASGSILLSKMTLTHQMARLLILEQFYRAFKIINNEKYHK